MALKSTDKRYGWVALAFHWVSALAIGGLIISGNVMEGLRGAEKLAILAIHVPVGLLVLALTVLRVVWWWLVDTKPPPEEGPAWQVMAARGVHLAFYAAIFLATMTAGLYPAWRAGRVAPVETIRIV